MASEVVCCDSSTILDGFVSAQDSYAHLRTLFSLVHREGELDAHLVGHLSKVCPGRPGVAPVARGALTAPPPSPLRAPQVVQLLCIRREQAVAQFLQSEASRGGEAEPLLPALLRHLDNDSVHDLLRSLLVLPPPEDQGVCFPRATTLAGVPLSPSFPSSLPRLGAEVQRALPLWLHLPDDDGVTRRDSQHSLATSLLSVLADTEAEDSHRNASKVHRPLRPPASCFPDPALSASAAPQILHFVLRAPHAGPSIVYSHLPVELQAAVTPSEGPMGNIGDGMGEYNGSVIPPALTAAKKLHDQLLSRACLRQVVGLARSAVADAQHAEEDEVERRARDGPAAAPVDIRASAKDAGLSAILALLVRPPPPLYPRVYVVPASPHPALARRGRRRWWRRPATRRTAWRSRPPRAATKGPSLGRRRARRARTPPWSFGQTRPAGVSFACSPA